MATMTNSLGNFWRGLGQGGKVALTVAVAMAIGLVVWLLFFGLREDYRTLFSQLTDSDAAAIVEELRRQKVPYRLADGGTTISVPAERVHDTRLSLMSTNVPLSGGVGFEIFDKQGLGTTEQTQRVSYQRALQGELARTIATLEGVKQARVHLVLPESTLFKRDREQPTAAVTLTMQPGSEPSRQQISGVQRLVAASVAGLEPTRVVVTDQRGVTLSASDSGSGATGAVEARLEVQTQIEAHIAQKVARMLDGALGAGKAIVTVNVSLGFDAVKTTTQDLLPLNGAGDSQGNAVVRRREVVSGSGSDAHAIDAVDTIAGPRRSSSTTEVEYEYGRRVEEVIAAPGAIRRVSVSVVVPEGLAQEGDRIREIIGAAAGIDARRGDVISVQALGPQPLSDAASHTMQDTAVESDAGPETGGPAASSAWDVGSLASVPLPLWIAVVLLAVVTLWSLLRPARHRALSEREREELLARIQRALGDDRNVTQMKAKQ